MGRGKIEIKRIENVTNRQVTFSKRRSGLLKKAHELAVLCDVQLGLVVFSTTGKMFEYSSPSSSMSDIINRYQRFTSNHFEKLDDQQMFSEMETMKTENEKLEACIRHLKGEDLNLMSPNKLNRLEQQLEISIKRVREQKNLLMHQQFENLRRKERLLVEHHDHMYHILGEQHAAMDHMFMDPESRIQHFGGFYQEDQSKEMLHLSPLTHHLHEFRLQPTQPNLQETSLHCLGLQL